MALLFTGARETSTLTAFRRLSGVYSLASEFIEWETSNTEKQRTLYPAPCFHICTLFIWLVFVSHQYNEKNKIINKTIALPRRSSGKNKCKYRCSMRKNFCTGGWQQEERDKKNTSWESWQSLHRKEDVWTLNMTMRRTLPGQER